MRPRPPSSIRATARPVSFSARRRRTSGRCWARLESLPSFERLPSLEQARELFLVLRVPGVERRHVHGAILVGRGIGEAARERFLLSLESLDPRGEGFELARFLVGQLRRRYLACC